MKKIDIPKIKRSADYIRYLAIEGIERAHSGHPGLPLGCAELGVLLYRYILKFNPQDPLWLNRDRFILSAGHGSMLLYSLLYSAGYNVSLQDLEEFRQLGSKTPGHPEYDLAVGVETTTGPLGQGFANAVGAAIEGKILSHKFNKKGIKLFDYNVYTLMGDGCNMEGISYEAGSLAGHLGLDNLIAIFDSNKITIDGNTDITFTEDVGKRYQALGWLVDEADINNLESVYLKLKRLKEASGKPKLLILTTTIGQGLDKKQGTSSIHGAPAGVDEIAYFIQNSQIRDIFEEEYGKEAIANTSQLAEILKTRVDNRAPLIRCTDHLQFMKEEREASQNEYTTWQDQFKDYKTAHDKEYKDLVSYTDFKLTEPVEKALLNYSEPNPDATRNMSGRILNLCAGEIPQIVGGTADLAGSTKATIKSSHYLTSTDFSGRNIAYGVREHTMGAVGNGLALSKTMIPFSSTFFTFFDYMKPAVRLAALMKLNHLFIFSHDSIYVGEDGPTHQAIEHLNSIRLLPDLYTFRPANDIETAFSYLFFFKRMAGPVAIITTRQKVAAEVMGKTFNRDELFQQFQKGAYIFYETEPSNDPELILCGSGSELSLAYETAKKIEERDKKRIRIVSIPCLELLAEADQDYKDKLFGEFNIPLVFIETASHRGVNFFYGKNVILIDLNSFGVSAPGKVAGQHFGFTPEAIHKKITNQI
jgi:transketolase